MKSLLFSVIVVCSLLGIPQLVAKKEIPSVASLLKNSYWGYKEQGTCLIFHHGEHFPAIYNLDIKVGGKVSNGKPLYRHELGVIEAKGNKIRCTPTAVYTTTGPIVGVRGSQGNTISIYEPNRVDLPKEVGKARIIYIHLETEIPTVTIGSLTWKLLD